MNKKELPKTVSSDTLIEIVNLGINENVTMWKYYKIVSEEEHYVVIIADDDEIEDLPKWMFGKRKQEKTTNKDY